MTMFELCGAGLVAVEGETTRVEFRFASEDGVVPTGGTIFGDDEVMDCAFHFGKLRLCIGDICAELPVLGRIGASGAVYVSAAALFEALAANARAQEGSGR